MLGMLAGGIIFGILGDRMGRVILLFGSILLYSVANIANGFVHSIEAYGCLAFCRGLRTRGRTRRRHHARQRSSFQGSARLRHDDCCHRRRLWRSRRRAGGEPGPLAARLFHRRRAWAGAFDFADERRRVGNVQPNAGDGKQSRKFFLPVQQLETFRKISALHPHRPAVVVRDRHPGHFLAGNSPAP